MWKYIYEETTSGQSKCSCHAVTHSLIYLQLTWVLLCEIFETIKKGKELRLLIYTAN